jgi:hypothetical protein
MRMHTFSPFLHRVVVGGRDELSRAGGISRAGIGDAGVDNGLGKAVRGRVTGKSGYIRVEFWLKRAFSGNNGVKNVTLTLCIFLTLRTNFTTSHLFKQFVCKIPISYNE